VIASIPSPPSGSLHIGPLALNAYGLMIALGVLAAAWLCGRRFEEKGIGTREDVNAVALWAVLAGVIGSRLYHVATDWPRFEGRYEDIPKIWEGGLGVPGGIFAGVLVGVWLIRKRGIPAGPALTAVAPSVPLAQAIGRLGNWFNQELFGQPTGLPWALEVDDETAVAAGYPAGTTFHPAFLYEALWNLGLCGVLLWIDRRFQPQRGRLMAMYVAGYGAGRFWIEGLRIDEAREIGPWRLNQWMAFVLVLAGGAYLLVVRDRPALATAPAAGDDADDDVDADVDLDDDDTADERDDDVVDDAGPADEEAPDVRRRVDQRRTPDGPATAARPSPSRTGAADPDAAPDSDDPPSPSS